MNIVERLHFRNRAAELGDNLCSDAAAEIERLRAAMEKITKMTTWPDDKVNTITLVAARAIARKALEPIANEQ